MSAAAAPTEAQTAVVPAVVCRRLRVVLGEQPVLRGIDLTVPTGVRLALVGPNGAGKSTLLRVIAGLRRPTSGEVEILQLSLASDPWHARRAVGLVGHLSMLHPDLTARENLAVFARLYGLDDVTGSVEGALNDFGLTERGDSLVSTLSRGMVQRLALARALLHDPPILLLDEAETGLDSRAHDQLAAALEASHGHRTVILASHDLSFVSEVADQVVFLRSGRVVGQVEAAGLGVRGLQERYSEALARPAGTSAAAPAVTAG